METPTFLYYAVVLLLATVVAVPLARRWQLGAVLGYLAAGALIGPSGLEIIGNPEQISHISELGVVLMLFVIGLELSPQRLWVMRHHVFGLGSLQVILTSFLLGLIAVLFGLGWKAALVVGLGLALSSTAIGLQILAERKELTSAHGRLAFAILLFQDVAAIPIIALIPVLGAAQITSNAIDVWAALRIIAVIVMVVVGGRYLLRPLFRAAARTQIPEVFTASALLVVIGTAWLMERAGISMSLGAFLAGVLLADSEYRHEIEAQIEPFKGLLLGLFFISVGMSVDLLVVMQQPQLVALLLFALLALKGLMLLTIGRTVGRLDNAQSLSLAAILAQGGEFAFVVFAVAQANGLLNIAQRDLLTVLITFSMAATPLLVIGRSHLSWGKKADLAPEYDAIEDDSPRVIIAGFGRVGQIVARILRAQHIPFTALESSIDQVEVSRRFGTKIYFGDPSRPDLLRAAHAAKAEVFVVATDDPDANIRTARLIRRQFPHLKLFARARNRQHIFRLMDLGVDGAVRETFYSSLELARQVMIALGVPAAIAAQRINTFCAQDEELLKAQHLVYDDETALVQSTQEALKELEALFEADLKK